MSVVSTSHIVYLFILNSILDSNDLKYYSSDQIKVKHFILHTAL